MSSERLLVVQPDILWENKPANFARVRRLIEAARPEPGTLVLLPEMFSTGFSMNTVITCQGPDREDETFLAGLARACGVTLLAGVVAPGADGRPRNEAVAFGPGGALITRYAKRRPFRPGGETEVHAAGDALATLAWGGFTVAPLICYDLRFPELFREAVRREVDLFAVIALWPVMRERHWLTLLQARAIENQAYVVGVNRCGREPAHAYSGRSVVVDPQGIVIADAGEQEGVLPARVDPAVVADWRQEFPALADL